MVKIELSRWGEKIGVAIPSTILERTHLHEGDIVDVEAAGDGLIVVRPLHKTLQHLLEGITADNVHSETLLSGPQGQEIW